jgi:hypothetical protein
MVGRLDGLTFGTLEIKLNGLAVGKVAENAGWTVGTLDGGPKGVPVGAMAGHVL